MTSAVLFDAGQVIYDRPRRGPRLHDFFTGLGLPSTLEPPQASYASELKDASWLGTITPRDYHEGMLRLHGVTRPADLTAGIELWEAIWPDVDLFPAVPETLHLLRSQGLKLGIVTNTLNSTAEKLGWFQRRGMPADLWSAFATSCELGLVKPDAAIYQHALRGLGTSPRETVFVGHAQVELDGAKAVGMSTIAFNRDDETVTADLVIDRFSDLLAAVARTVPQPDAPDPDSTVPHRVEGLVR